MTVTAIRFDPKPTGRELCAWCRDEDRRQAVIAILWRHERDLSLDTLNPAGDGHTDADSSGWTTQLRPPDGCWCESIPGNDGRHVSWACWRHIERDADDLRALGFRVLGAKDTGR